MKPILAIPENWPCMWGSGHNVRLSCPQCGGFTLHLVRSDDGASVRNLSCETCDLHGVAATQRAFNKVIALIASKAPKPIELKEATA